jgi:hypothetical protein
MLKYAVWIILSIGATAGLSSPAALPVVQILDAVTEKHLCTGVFIERKRVLTARHCFSTANSRRYIIKHPENRFTSEVDKIHFYENDSRHFPNRDLALLDLSHAPESAIQFPQIAALKPHRGMQVTAFGRGYQDERLDPGAVGSLKKISGKLGTIYHGFRIEHLARFEAQNGTLCVGDSGGPLLAQKAGKYFLIGWINGLWDPITQADGECARESVVTPVAPYAAWIQKPLSSSSNVSEQPVSSLEEACRKRDLSPDRDLLIQKILLQLVDSEPDRHKKLAMLQECTDLDRAWNELTGQGRPLILDVQTSIKGMMFLTSLKGLELSNITQHNIKDLMAFQNLEQLTLNGATQPIDLTGLNLQNLKSLSVKNARSLKDLGPFISRHPMMESISLLDIKNEEGPVLMSWFAELKYLKRLKIGMAQVNRDITLRPEISLRIW